MINMPEYMRIRQYVVDILSRHADIETRIMSERELSKKFNVARDTVRKALKELVAEGLIKVKRGKGMFVRPEKFKFHIFPLKRFYKIMIVWGSGKWVYLEGTSMNVMEMACRSLKKYPVHLLTSNFVSDNADIADELSMYNPDAILWTRPPDGFEKAIAKIRERIPVCVLGNPPGDGVFAVSMDYVAAGRLAAAFFLDRKLPRTAIVGVEKHWSIKNDVYKGWREEFSARGLEYDSELAVEAKPDMLNKLKGLLAAERLDGIFSFGSEFAVADAALKGSAAKIPVMVDENYYAFYKATCKPVAKLIFFPPEMAEAAAENVFKSVEDTAFIQKEIVFKPFIKTAQDEEREKP